MSSPTQPFPSYRAARRSNSFDLRRLFFWFALTLCGVIVFGAAFAIGYARMNEGRVLPGVSVAGIDLAGLSPRAAETRLRTELPDLSAGELNVRVAGREESIPYAYFGRDYDTGYMLSQAFALGRGDNFIAQLQEQLAILVNGASVSPTVTWNNEELSTRVAVMAAAAQEAPVDASITRADGRYVVSPSSDGTAVDMAQVVQLAMDAINNTSATSAQIVV
ncbi:MAG TPA: peptidoglycan binding domain-containing protein, partial [Gemmatimonadaceae bacterium]|nr:peptidoglycan binding domain-containing protein [Gemmatimonadaceae bacterium]